MLKQKWPGCSKEKEEAMAQAQEYAGAFQTGNQNKGDNGEGE